MDIKKINEVMQKKLPDAWVVSTKDKGRKSIKDGNVYLSNNEEFMVEIFNPLVHEILCFVKINNELISENGLIIKPDQRFYLDRFLHNNKKFIYKTNEVEKSEEVFNSILNNGIIEIFFYRQAKGNSRDYSFHYKYYDFPNTGITYTTNKNYINNELINDGRYNSSSKIEIDNVEGVVNASTFTRDDTFSANYNDVFICHKKINILPLSQMSLNSRSNDLKLNNTYDELYYINCLEKLLEIEYKYGSSSSLINREELKSKIKRFLDHI